MKFYNQKTETTWQDLIDLSGNYRQVNLDIGTGDGMFVLREAKANKENFYFGLDAADNFSKAYKKANKNENKGGAKNCAFIIANALNLTKPDNPIFDKITINYPWGSLLHAVANKNRDFILSVDNLLKANGVLSIVLNMYVFEDDNYREHLDLNTWDDKTFLDFFESLGLKNTKIEYYEDGNGVELKSSWGGHLTKNSKRNVLLLEFKK